MVMQGSCRYNNDHMQERRVWSGLLRKRPCRLSKTQMTVVEDNCGRGRSTCIRRNINCSVHKNDQKNPSSPDQVFMIQLCKEVCNSAVSLHPGW